MAVPKKKPSKSRRGMRNAHRALTRQYLIVCPQCGEAVQRHRVCLACGYYRSKSIVEVAEA